MCLCFIEKFEMNLFGVGCTFIWCRMYFYLVSDVPLFGVGRTFIWCRTYFYLVSGVDV